MKNSASFAIVFIAILTTFITQCHSSRQAISEPSETIYISPAEYGYPLSIDDIESYAPTDSSFVPISVKGGMRQAFGKVIYPDKALQENIQGRVILELYVNSKGDLDKYKIIQSPDSVLVEAALDAAQKWDYNPATLNNDRVASFIRIPINFRTSVQKVGIDN